MKLQFSVPVRKKQNIAALIQKQCGKAPSDFRILKKSVDARKSSVRYVYSVEAVFDGKQLDPIPRLEAAQVCTDERPVVVGYGPCGMFAAYFLAKSGMRPIVLERGCRVEQRRADIEAFHKSGILNPHSNVQFGEGGAGTFSDGKLTTLIGNPLCKEVLELFIECGAPEEIRFLARPHIGTDILRHVVTNLRRKTEALGGEFHFNTPVTDFVFENKRLVGLKADRLYPTHHCILAIGHSARDTLERLYDLGIPMVPKAFSVGARIEHPQSLINSAQYGADAKYLGAADYKLSYHTQNGRGVYTFCMCPGGEVMAAASESERVVTNGMSYHARDGRNANAALLVGVDPKDYGSDHPLAGMFFQRRLESLAFKAGGGNYFAPCQLLGDFMSHRPSSHLGSVTPTYLPGVTPCSLDAVLPDFITQAMREAIPVFADRLRGFDLPDTVLTAVESRTSSPVRILRDERFQSEFLGLYPAGEGAGFAGGIMSAAVDGIKIALQIINAFR